ncbi:MAG: hypothetical protein JWP80_5005 [Pseudomonas sp.]|nr:hypothetical protein [Pseudomonas sp.]
MFSASSNINLSHVEIGDRLIFQRARKIKSVPYAPTIPPSSRVITITDERGLPLGR